MATRLSVLQNVEIATPCPADWNDMKGDDRVRFCGQCRLHVYDFATLSRDEAERLIRETEGRLCGRIYRRDDGTIMTRDCPVGFQKVRRTLAGWVGRVAAAIVLVGGTFGLFRTVMGDNARTLSLARLEPFATMQRWLDPSPPPARFLMMGAMRVRPVPPPPPSLSPTIQPSNQ